MVTDVRRLGKRIVMELAGRSTFFRPRCQGDVTLLFT